MIWFVVGFGIGAFFGVATVSCLVAARKGDEQSKFRDDYAQGFEDGYNEGLHDAQWKGGE